LLPNSDRSEYLAKMFHNRPSHQTWPLWHFRQPWGRESGKKTMAGTYEGLKEQLGEHPQSARNTTSASLRLYFAACKALMRVSCFFHSSGHMGFDCAGLAGLYCLTRRSDGYVDLNAIAQHCLYKLCQRRRRHMRQTAHLVRSQSVISSSECTGGREVFARFDII
jgi:hypothetical protein